MLEIELEFKKGILFVRLGGILNKETIGEFSKKVTSLIKETGIRKIIFNMSNLTSVDLDGVEELYNNYKINHNKNGNTLICGINNDSIKNFILRSRLLKDVEKTRGEMEAIKIINA